jgi:hypothetical protein
LFHFCGHFGYFSQEKIGGILFRLLRLLDLKMLSQLVGVKVAKILRFFMPLQVRKMDSLLMLALTTPFAFQLLSICPDLDGEE